MIFMVEIVLIQGVSFCVEWLWQREIFLVDLGIVRIIFHYGDSIKE